MYRWRRGVDIYSLIFKYVYTHPDTDTRVYVPMEKGY